MKKLLLLFSFIFLFSSVPVFAQNTEYASSRLVSLASTLKRYTVDLSDDVYRDFKNRYSNSRSDIDTIFLAQQLDASAFLFQEMVRDNRRSSELRDAANALYDLARRSPSYGSNYRWRDAQRTIDDIKRELGSSGGSSGGFPGDGPGNYAGKVTWRGMVDDVIQIDILNRALGVRTISGTPYPTGNYNFSTSLPRRNVEVFVVKKKGRGNVRVVQQPNSSNNYGAVVEVRDTDGGAKEYELEIYWR